MGPPHGRRLTCGVAPELKLSMPRRSRIGGTSPPRSSRSTSRCPGRTRAAHRSAPARPLPGTTRSSSRKPSRTSPPSSRPSQGPVYPLSLSMGTSVTISCLRAASRSRSSPATSPEGRGLGSEKSFARRLRFQTPLSGPGRAIPLTANCGRGTGGDGARAAGEAHLGVRRACSAH